MGNKQAWKALTREHQGDVCLICGEHVDPTQGSWDHLVPQVVSMKGHRAERIGLAFWTHRQCNSDRGHKMPTDKMLVRAAAVIGTMPEEHQATARQNIKAALDVHLAIVEMLRDFSFEVEGRQHWNGADGDLLGAVPG